MSARRDKAPHAPWPMARLGDVCDEIKDRIQSSKIAVDEYVTTDNMVKDRGGIGQAEYVPSDVGLVEYHKGDVLVANIRPYLKKIWLADHDGGCSSDVVVFRTNTDGLSSEYLYSVLSQDAYFEYVMQKPRGTKMPRGDRDWMKEFRFPLPPLFEQKEIVARLERELAAVEKMKKVFEALAETAKAEFKAELKEVFEELKSGGVESGTGGTNGTVETRRLGEICEFMTSGSRGWAKYYSDSGELFITIKNVKDCAIDVHQVQHVKPPNGAETERTRVKEGDLLISITADLGRTGVVTKAIEAAGAYINQHLICIRLKKDMMLPMFAAYYVESEDGKKQIAHRNKEAVKAGLNFASVSSILLPFPSLPVQRQIVDRLSAAKARTEKLEAKAREGVAVCETMRKAILKEAFE